MPNERGMCYWIRGLIRLDQEAYEAAYQDAQSSLHVRPLNDVTHYLRAMAGYYSGHLTHLKEDTQIALQSKEKLISKSMKSNMRHLQKLLLPEPIIDKDFMENLRHQFFDEVDDMIDSTDDLAECFATWTSGRFENKMGSSIQKSMEYLRESLAKLNKSDLPEKLKIIQEYLQLCVDRHFTQACLDLMTPNDGPNTTLEQLRAWKQQVLLIMDGYDKVNQALVEKLEELAVLYQIPVF